jgi:hypothetical protein
MGMAADLVASSCSGFVVVLCQNTRGMCAVALSKHQDCNIFVDGWPLLIAFVLHTAASQGRVLYNSVGLTGVPALDKLVLRQCMTSLTCALSRRMPPVRV